jgi:hypothetical protein
MNQLSPAKEEELLRYLDGELDADQRTNLENEIQQSDALQTRLDELRVVHSYLKNQASFQHPSKTFTQKVMSQLDAQPATSLFTPGKGLLLLVGIIIASGISLMLLSNGVFDQTSTLIVDTAPIKNKWIQDISFSIPFNGKILVNAILFINLGLALILLDRTILRPLFQKRTSMEY